MLYNFKYLKTAMLLLMLLANGAFGQDTVVSSTPLFGFDVGYFSPLGGWKKHRYAENVDQFQGSYKIGAEFETKILGAGIGLFWSYSRLDISEWENYAQNKGDMINASASITDFGMVFKYHFLTKYPNLVNLDFGAGYFIFKGHETFASYSYDYSFLNSGLGFIVGLGYKRFLNDKIVFVVNIRGILVLEAVKYPDDINYDVMGVPITVGIRYKI